MMRAAAVTFVSKKAIDPLYEKDSLATYTHIESQTVYVCCSCLCRQCTDYLSMVCGMVFGGRSCSRLSAVVLTSDLLSMLD